MSSETPPAFPPAAPSSLSRWGFILGLPILLVIAVLVASRAFNADQPARAATTKVKPFSPQYDLKNPVAAKEEERLAAPELDGGLGWLNTAQPIKMKDLKGKIVLLDFWTLCCINCIHTLPDLARLEKKFSKELVVIGVHTAKFENEKETASIRKAILRYEITHPVVNDGEQKIWDAYGVRSWPTLVLIDPEGNLVGVTSGEGNYEILDTAITKLIKLHKEKKTLDEKPVSFELVRERGESPLYFPGKVLADAAGNRLFIADSTNHRVVVTDLDGKKIAVIGAGTPGKEDGGYTDARFNDPQGLAVKGDTLYVADRKNHEIRAVDLKAQKVTTIAGTGFQDRERGAGGPALETGLNSPWDIHLEGDRLYIAMAGHHQIWYLELKKGELFRYAGNGRENIKDGSLALRSEFAQPSGLASDGKNLYVADSEVSAIRQVPLDGKSAVKTIVGRGLFDFGDVDGTGDEVRLQHALGVAYHDGLLYVADTYNSKLKVIDPEKRTSKTFLGGGVNGWLTGGTFDAPAGLSFANGKLYVADTNAHRIRVVDLKTKTVSTLKLQGVEPVAKAKKAG